MEHPLTQEGENATDSLRDSFDKDAIDYSRRINMDEVATSIAGALGNLYYAIYYIWLDNHQFVCFREDIENLLAATGSRGNADEAFALYIDRYIEPEDQEDMRAFVDMSTLGDRLSGMDALSHEYRRLDLGWTRCQFLVSHRDENGRASHVIYVVSDINAEMALVAKERNARFLSEHDALTGALNRTAFEQAVSTGFYAGDPMGFALVDVDNFKTFNDEHGHGFGDEVLTKVVQAIRSTFRTEDRVFRIGGDEFAIILKGCKASSWGTICQKFERIHRLLSTLLPEGGDVTLSAGVCFGLSGYESWMFDVADKGLYRSKEQGRGGCTLMNKDGSVAASWRDDEASAWPSAVFAGASSGACRIEFSHDKSVKPRFFCGDALKNLYGMPEGLTPEERFDYWLAGVDESYKGLLMEARREMMQSANVECTFLWGYAGREPFYVRSVGAGKSEDGADVIFAAHRSLAGAKIVEKDKDSHLIVEAQNQAYVCSYLIDKQAGVLSVLKQSPTAWTVDLEGLDANEGLAALSRKLVCENDVARVLEFLDLSTLDQRMGAQSSLMCEWEATTDAGWCRGTLLPVKRDGQGAIISAMLTVASIDAVKQEQMRREREDAFRMKLYYEAAETMLGTKILSMVLLDRETGQGRSWVHSSNFSQCAPVSYQQLWDRDRPFADDAERDKFDNELTMETVLRVVDERGHYEVTVKFRAANGQVRFFTYHFSLHSDDESMLLVVVEDSTALHNQEGRSIEDLYDNVPAGLVSYEWNKGVITPLHVSKNYGKLCDRTVCALLAQNGIDYERLHPDDVAGYKVNVDEALANKHEAHYVYRVKNAASEGYSWVKIDAVVKPRGEDSALVYALYSDVNELMEAKQGLVKTQTSLDVALKMSNQMIWEYDIEAHKAFCYTENNALGLPRVIENYPEALDDFAVFVSEDRAVFREAVKKIDDGADSAQCDVRIRVDGAVRWFSCQLYAQKDPSSGRRMAMLFVADANVRKLADKSFQDRVESLLYGAENTLSIGVYNLDKGTVLEVHAQGGVLSGDEIKTDYDEVLEIASEGIIDADDRQKYLELFNRANLLSLANEGKQRVAMECLYRIEPGHTEWMEVSAELAINPATGEAEAVGVVKSINDLRLSNVLLKQLMQHSNNSYSLLFDQGEEYYLYDGVMGSICAHHVDYWGDLRRVLASVCNKDELDRMVAFASKDAVVSRLAAGEKPQLAFDGVVFDKPVRLEMSFSKVEGQDDVIFASMRDITDTALLEKFSRDARHDALTGLYNRNTVFARCEQLLQAHPDTTFAMVKLNVRRFRLFNSFFGEAAGDALLKEVAAQLREMESEYPISTYGRLESDIFCAFVPYDEAMLKRHVEEAQRRFASYNDDFPLEPSFGVYVVSDRSLPVEGMFARASSAAKEGGTCIAPCAWSYNDDLEQKLDTEVFITNEMQNALDEEQFKVYLQPQFNLQTGAFSGAEALVRWVHPQRGVISPAMFIPVFERNGFVTSLDRYMWEHVCKLIRSWTDEGRRVFPVSVNMSRASAYNPASAHYIIKLARQYQIDPRLLELELTESAYIDQPEELLHSTRLLQEAGFRVLMDDFGTGYSSLNTLRELPVDMIKLDMGFLSETCDDARGRTVVSSVLSMSEELGLQVIAEGVENKQQADFLRAAGCDYVQGFYFARPMSAHDFESMMPVSSAPYAS